MQITVKTLIGSWQELPKRHILGKLSDPMNKRKLIDAFVDDFYQELKQARTNPDAFERASAKFENRHGFTDFDDYDQFRRKKKRSRR